jgi:hypothetical protein
MDKILFAAMLLLALTGCASAQTWPTEPSACSAGESTYACQVERYNNVSVD